MKFGSWTYDGFQVMIMIMIIMMAGMMKIMIMIMIMVNKLRRADLRYEIWELDL